MSNAPHPASIDVRSFSWTPLGNRHPAIDEVDLQIQAGERILITGPSGSGKSTLVRAIAGVLADTADGKASGQITIDGRSPLGGDSGLLLSDPSAGMVASTIGRDVAFGMENRGIPRAQIWPRVDEVLSAVDIAYPRQHSTLALSGGEAQRVGLAGVIAPPSGLLLLDEPLSMLDPVSANRVFRAVERVVADRNTTLIVIEHRIDTWVGLCDRVVVMEAGRILAQGPPERILRENRETLARAGVWIPGMQSPVPHDIPEQLCAPHTHHDRRTPLVEVSQLSVRYRPPRGLRVVRAREPDVWAVRGLSTTASAGQWVSVTGNSGAGKSTLLGAICGLAEPTEGDISATPAFGRELRPELWKWTSPQLARRIGWAPQRASLTTIGQTCEDSALATARALGIEAAERCHQLFECLGISHLLNRDPHAISGGEARRLSVVSSVMHGPELLGLDEPTVGQDRGTWSAVAGLIQAATTAGTAIVAATHDEALSSLATEHILVTHSSEASC